MAEQEQPEQVQNNGNEAMGADPDADAKLELMDGM
jgi:hypothetical protein